jgi:hypothetical protein
MRLLVLTQSIDRNDPTLGFMHRWIEKFSERFEKVTVICLKKGDYTLPHDVEVLSLGKELKAESYKLKAFFRFYKYIWQKRKNYDAVFVHMNEEYVLLGGLLWRIWGKPVYFWRNHVEGSWRTRIAGRLSKSVFYTSPQSYTAQFKNAVQMPVGIDTDRFAFGDGPREGVLILGRIDPIKRVLEMTETAIDVAREHTFKLTIAGDPSPGSEAYAQSVTSKLKDFLGKISYLKSIPNAETPKYFGSTDIVMNFTPSGSFDKVIFEAASCGALILTTNMGLAKRVPAECYTELNDSKEALLRLLRLPEDRKRELRRTLRKWVEAEHSLSRLTDTLQQMVEGVKA